jgi:hypothetical protein
MKGLCPGPLDDGETDALASSRNIRAAISVLIKIRTLLLQGLIR